ncbi:hypothetical protein MASR1M66_24430 [Aminivibrio sp.]
MTLLPFRPFGEFRPFRRERKTCPAPCRKRLGTGIFLLALLFVLSLSTTAGAAEFSFTKGLFVKEVKGFGMYTEEETSRFEKGSKVTIYLEVDGFQLVKQEKDYKLNLSLDLHVKDDKGNTGIEQAGVVTADLLVKSLIHDFFFTVNIDLAELPPGKYTLSFIATDNTNGKKTSYDMDIEIYPSDTAKPSGDGSKEAVSPDVPKN